MFCNIGFNPNSPGGMSSMEEIKCALVHFYPLMKKSYVSVLISVVKLELAAQKGPEIIF